MTPPRTTSTTLFEEAIDVPLWLEADAATPYAERVRRDRDIARAIEAEAPVERVRAWWRCIPRPDSDGGGERLEQLRRLVGLGMAVVGALTGAAVAMAAFHYDGTYPVNVVTLLALLVGVQLALLLLTLLLIPGRLPGLRPLQDLLAAVNPGALAAALYRRLAKPPPDFVRLFGWQPGRTTAASRFAKWQLLYWSQIAGVAFNLSALATGAVTIAFTDLAFGWSTTLAADPALVHEMAEVIAWPWHALLPTAVPDFALIERSQFFRLDGGGDFDGDAPRALAGWWSFIILAIVTYGLLPRLALLAFAGYRLRTATEALLLEDPRVTALLDRMTTPDVEWSPAAPDETYDDGSAPRALSPGPLSGLARAIIWSGSIAPAAAQEYARTRLRLELTDVFEAGSGRGLEDDRLALAALPAGDTRTIAIFTPAWEPPLLEFLDFLAALRERVGSAASIIVTPVAEDLEDVSPVERDTWAYAIGRSTDPRLYLETGAA